MERNLIECIVSKKNKKKKFFVRNFEELLTKVKNSFNIESNTAFEILDEDDAELDSHSFDISSIKNNNKLTLKVDISD